MAVVPFFFVDIHRHTHTHTQTHTDTHTHTQTHSISSFRGLVGIFGCVIILYDALRYASCVNNTPVELLMPLFIFQAIALYVRATMPAIPSQRLLL